jgi:hypothetical protein
MIQKRKCYIYYLTFILMTKVLHQSKKKIILKHRIIRYHFMHAKRKNDVMIFFFFKVFFKVYLQKQKV